MKHIRILLILAATLAQGSAQTKTVGPNGEGANPAAFRAAISAPAASELPTWSTLSGKPSTFPTSLADLTQSSATTGQVPTWNGTSWVASTPASSGTWGSITGTLSSQTDLNSALSGKLAGDGTVATLRTANLAGSDNIATVNRKLSKLWLNHTRKAVGNAGVSNSNRGVVLTLGDSVATNVSPFVQKWLGYGGASVPTAQITDTGGTLQVGGTCTGYTDQWTRTPNGTVRSMTGSDTMTINAPGAMTAVAVSYLAKNGGGSFKVQYEANKTGGYVDATGAWAIETLARTSMTTLNSTTIYVGSTAGLVAGMTVSGTGISGGTTISSVNNASVTKTGSGSVTNVGGEQRLTLNSVTGLAPNMMLAGGGLDNLYIVSVNVAGSYVVISGGGGVNVSGQSITFTGRTVTLSANATAAGTVSLNFARVDAGSDAGSGVLSTNNSNAGGGTGGTAAASVSAQAVTSIAVTNGGSGYVDPPYVQITGGGGSGAIAYATVSGGVVTGITVAQHGAGYTSTPTVTLISEKYCTAIIKIPNGTTGADYYNIKIVPTSGTVDICDVKYEDGGFGVAQSGYTKAGWFDCDWSLGGKQVSAHFNWTPQGVWDRALAWTNPDLIVFKGLNDWGKATLVDGGYWLSYINKIRSAAPNALIVVAGSHNTRAYPDRDSGGWRDMDDWMRSWCATNDCVFVDVSSNMPPYTDDAGSADMMWSDGLHIYDSGDQMRGWGQSYVAGLVWTAIKPAFDQFGSMSPKALNYNSERPIPGYPNVVKLFNGNSSSQYNTTDQKFTFEGAPRKTVTVSARQQGAAGTNYANESGFQAVAATTSTSVTALNLLHNGADAMTFGVGSNGGFWGFALGVDQSAGSNYGRTTTGYRFKVPWKTYTRNGVIIEGRSDTDATDRVFGIDIGATDASAGTNLWSWNVGDGSNLPQVIYHGRTNDSNVTRFTYEEPAAAVTVHTPVNATAGTGANARVIGVIPSYANQAAGEAAVGQGEVFYDEASKKVRVDLNP